MKKPRKDIGFNITPPKTRGGINPGMPRKVNPGVQSFKQIRQPNTRKH